MPESDFGAIPRGRIGRGVALMAASVITIAVAGINFVRPDLSTFGFGATASSSMPYAVEAVDFVVPTVGWVLVDFPSGRSAILHTEDGGLTWRKELTAPSNGHRQYLKFFDAFVGVFALVGTRPVLHRTFDGGQTWSSLPALAEGALALSWSFVDSHHGWMLVDPGNRAPAALYRTEDGGLSWTPLGTPVKPPDQAFQVHFPYLTTGWVAGVSSGPYAYRTDDFGETWARVPLPAPAAGWSRGGQFFVAVQPTSGAGLAAAVVSFPPIKGRTGVGAVIRAFPPLTVRAYDGGRLRTNTYATLIDQLAGGPAAQDPAPNQAMLSTVDEGSAWSPIQPPSRDGAIASFGAADWWWVGSGQMATSRDGGMTWTASQAIDAVAPKPGSLQVLNRYYAWFVAGSKAALETTSDGGAHWRLVALPPLNDAA